ncbi:hypothetical protein G7054_g1684 [Neopestalotiopsis clavispora]|nr:hypothetical protein G7054_g1684 [Neopestalotiopsis clavispora]
MAHQNEAINSTLRDEETVSSLLKSKRKARAVKSCFPCRHRRVRCDGGSPCSSCLARGHAELCQRQAGVSAAAAAAATTTTAPAAQVQPSRPTASAGADSRAAGLLLGGGSNGKDDEDPDLVIKRLEQIEEQISSIKADLKRKAQSQSQENTANARSRDSAARGPAKAAGQHFLERDTGATIFLGSHADPPTALGLMPLFGPSSAFDGLAPRTYAFANLWTPEIDIEEVCKTLPEDRDIIRYWQIYQACVYPYYPALVSLDEFSVSLFAFLDCSTEARAKTVSTWLGLLFALLACGAQFSDDPVEERELRSKVFGLTIRLAQSIGLHEEARSAESPGPAVTRKRLCTSVETIAIPYESTEGYSFADATLTVIKVILDRSREDPSQLNTQPRFEHYTSQLVGIEEESASFLRDKANCKTLQEHLERLALQIHIGYARCRIYRLYLENNTLDPATRESRTLEYSAHAATVVQSFLDMHRLSANACRASAFIHNVVSSAVALKDLMSRSRRDSPLSPNNGGVGPAWDASFEQCTQRLIKVLEREQEKSEWTDSDTNVRRFGPYSRALLALKETFGLPQQSV